MNSIEAFIREHARKYGLDARNGSDNISDSFTAGANLIVEQMGKFMEWMDGNKYYIVQAGMHANEWSMPGIGQYWTTTQLIDLYFQELSKKAK